MFTFVEFVDYSLLKVYLAQKMNQDLLEYLVSNQPVLEKKIVDSFAQLDDILGEGAGLFDDNVIENFLIDVQGLVVDEKSVDVITQLCAKYNTLDVVFYSSIVDSLSADLKKLWQKSGFEYQVLKTRDLKLAEDLGRRYMQKIGLDLSDKDFSILLKESNYYLDLIDNLDFVSLAPDTIEAVKTFVSEEKVPIFMMGFDPLKASTQVDKWYREIGEDDLQLALSLICTKLDKNGSERAKKLLKKLILTDQKIKTRSKVGALTWYRLFLWEAVNEA